MITIVDYGAGNLRSVTNAMKRLGYEARITSDPADVASAGVVILPGVGAAGDTVDSLDRLGLSDAIRRYIAQDRPFMGICVGLQVLFTATEEGGGHRCLDVLPGRVRRLPEGRKIPHMGWNQVRQLRPHPLFEGVPDGANFYFVHSFYADPEDRAAAAGETEYGIDFCSVAASGSVVATQFHPEKSGEIGLRIYDNFLRRCAAVAPNGG